MMKFIFIIFSIILLSCSSPHKIEGRYVTCSENKLAYVSEKLILKKDSTFVFNWQYGLRFGETKGVWNKTKDTIVLDSYNIVYDSSESISSIPNDSGVVFNNYKLIFDKGRLYDSFEDSCRLKTF